MAWKGRISAKGKRFRHPRAPARPSVQDKPNSVSRDCVPRARSGREQALREDRLPARLATTEDWRGRRRAERGPCETKPISGICLRGAEGLIMLNKPNLTPGCCAEESQFQDARPYKQSQFADLLAGSRVCRTNKPNFQVLSAAAGGAAQNKANRKKCQV